LKEIALNNLFDPFKGPRTLPTWIDRESLIITILAVIGIIISFLSGNVTKIVGIPIQKWCALIGFASFFWPRLLLAFVNVLLHPSFPKNWGAYLLYCGVVGIFADAFVYFPLNAGGIFLGGAAAAILIWGLPLLVAIVGLIFTIRYYQHFQNRSHEVR
jgi:hypothetical protein